MPITSNVQSFKEMLAPPKPIIKLGTNWVQGYNFPTLTEDGSYIHLPYSGTDSFFRYDNTNTAIWQVNKGNIDSSVNYWAGAVWLDRTDEKLWVWAVDTDTTPDTYYLANIALSDGTITQVGSCQPGDGLFNYYRTTYYTERAEMGSGDLTIRDGEQQIVISTTDGSIVTPATQITQNGIVLANNVSYQTENGKIYLGYPTVGDSNYSIGAYCYIQRGGVLSKVVLPILSPGAITTGYSTLWDGYVAVGSGTTGTMYNARFFERADFDDWLKRIADYYGFPE